MDCNKLRKDIEELNSIRDKLSEKINNATETGKGKTEIVALAKEAEEETDAVLEQYLDDFFEKNPQLLSVKLSEHCIEGFRDDRGRATTINAISPLPNGNMLIGGHKDALYEYQKQPDGSYKLSKHRIEGFKDKDGDETTIRAISPLSNGDMLIGGHYGALYEYQKQPDGSYKLSEHRIEGFKDKDGDETDINAIFPLPNGNMLIGGHKGALYEYQKQPDGSYRLSKHRIEGFKDKYGDETHVFAISPLPNGNMLIGGHYGALYEYQKQPDGSYKLSEHRIEGFKEKDGDETDIYAISPLPDGNMLIGGHYGALHEAQVPPKSLETLKQSLDQIVEQE